MSQLQLRSAWQRLCPLCLPHSGRNLYTPNVSKQSCSPKSINKRPSTLKHSTAIAKKLTDGDVKLEPLGYFIVGESGSDGTTNLFDGRKEIVGQEGTQSRI